MSRKVANILEKLINGFGILQSKRQRQRTISRLVEKLTNDDLAVIETSLGRLKVNKNRSPHVASAAYHFFKDEPETLEWIGTMKSGDIFYDVGAASGIYSLYACLKPEIEVFSFEPNALSFGLLIENIKTNNFKNIKAFCLALSDTNEQTHLSMKNFSAGAGGNSLDQVACVLSNDQEIEFKQPIFSYSLDHLISEFDLPRPTYLKIDVDGLEPLVLKGAVSTLTNVDTILIEIEKNVLNLHKKNLINFLGSLGFYCQDEINEKKRNYIFRK